jgi:predicted transcriptional regulator
MSKKDYVVDGDLFEPGSPRTEAVTLGDSPVDAPTTDEALRVLFGFADSDLRTYEVLLEAQAATTAELESRLDRDRSNINRSLSRLRDAGFVTRRRRILQSGGQVYQYVPEPPATARHVMETAIAEWAETAHERLSSHFDELA